MKQTRPLFVIGVLLLLLSSACTQQKDDNEWQHQIKRAAELSTVKYSVQQIICHTDESWKFLGNKKILLKYQAEIKAGIDIEKLDLDRAKITVNKKKGTRAIAIVLPKPEIFSYNIKPDGIEQLYKEVSWLRSDYTNEERDKIISQAEAELKKDAELNEMIYKDARLNAFRFFEMILLQNGFDSATITFEK